MIKLVNLKNILSLLMFFLNDSLSGILNRPFLKKKINIFLSILVGLAAYISYFILNTIEAEKIHHNIDTLNNSNILYASELTVLSLYNITIVVSIIMFIFITNTIYLSVGSLFVSKVLPYKHNEIALAYIFFKLLIGILLFNLFIINCFPMLKVLPMNMADLLRLIVGINMCFIVVFFVIQMLYSIVKISKFYSAWIHLVIDLLIITLTFYYFFSVRFKVERIIVDFVKNLYKLNNLCFGISFFLLIIFITIYSQFTPVIKVYKKSNYYNFPYYLSKYYLLRLFPSIIRTKIFIYMLIVYLSIAAMNFIEDGFKGVLLTFPFWNLINISAIAYFESNISFRRRFNGLLYGTFYEFLSILCFGIVFQIPLLFLLLGIHQNIMINVVLGFCIFLMSIVVGFLFPKSGGNLNETFSTFILLLFLIVIAILVQINIPIYWILLFLIIMVLKIIQSESRV